MTGWLWPLVLLVLVDTCRAGDLDSLRSQLLRTHPELNAARRRIQAAELETGLAGRARAAAA
jgi:outer membrane protein TolC